MGVRLINKTNDKNVEYLGYNLTKEEMKRFKIFKDELEKELMSL